MYARCVSWEVFGQAMVAILTIGAAFVQFRRSTSYPRENLRHDLEILAKLPRDSEARAKLAGHIEDAVIRSLDVEDDKRRDPTGIALGVIFIVGGSAAAYYGFQTETFWRLALWVLAALLLLLGIPGFVQDVTKRKRDAAGRPI